MCVRVCVCVCVQHTAVRTILKVDTQK